MLGGTHENQGVKAAAWKLAATTMPPGTEMRCGSCMCLNITRLRRKFTSLLLRSVHAFTSPTLLKFMVLITTNDDLATERRAEVDNMYASQSTDR